MSRGYVRIATLIIALVSCYCQADDTQPEYPADDYTYYSGNEEERGTLFFRQQNFRHQETGKTISLIGMIHVADKAYYEEVQVACAPADVVLSEGVSGRDNLSAYSFFMTYLMALYQRIADLQGCSEQTSILLAAENWQHADLTSTEFASHRKLHHELGMVVLLPVTMVVCEPSIMATECVSLIQKLRGKQPHHFATVRHTLNTAMEQAEAKRADEDHKDKEELLLPGIISARNNRLMSKIQESLADPDCQSIAVPWGAAHMPDIEKRLLTQGFQKTTHKWFRAQAVKELVAGTAAPDPKTRKIYIPYLFSHRTPPNGRQTSFLARLIATRRHNEVKSVSLGYGQIMTSVKSSKGRRLTVLPQIFGRPLLLDYRQKTDDADWRASFLLFFHLSGKNDSSDTN